VDSYRAIVIIVTTTYSHDATGRLLQVRKALSSVSPRITTYTPTGKVKTTTVELGGVTQYAYDDFDRIVTTTRPDNTTTTSAYDAEGRRTSSTDAAGNTTSYAPTDALGHTTTLTCRLFSLSGTTIDALGHTTTNEWELGISLSSRGRAAPQERARQRLAAAKRRALSVMAATTPSRSPKT
jgi:YD repeat-containing protein